MPIATINNHQMYYEIHGQGKPTVYIGGWDTFCHGREHYLARGITDEHQVLIIDYRGIGESDDDPSIPATTELHADDMIALLDHLGWSNVYFIGLVGIGACIGHWVALKRPDLVRCMVNMGCWVHADKTLTDILNGFGAIHEHAGFTAFQEMVAAMSFRAGLLRRKSRQTAGPGGCLGCTERPLASAFAIHRCLQHARHSRPARRDHGTDAGRPCGPRYDHRPVVDVAARRRLAQRRGRADGRRRARRRRQGREDRVQRVAVSVSCEALIVFAAPSCAPRGVRHVDP